MHADVILSLVRTRSVGYLRDVRRLIVAVSRARLGLYVLGRFNVFAACLDLKPVFDKFAERPLQLALVPSEEAYMTTSRNVGETGAVVHVPDVYGMWEAVQERGRRAIAAELPPPPSPPHSPPQ